MSVAPEISTLPPIAILADKHMPGCKTLDDQVEPLAVTSFHEAFNNHHPTDAHFVCYTVSDVDAFPRLTKVVLPRMRTLGRRVLLNCFVLDWDNPEHAAWKPGAIDQFLAMLAEKSVTFPLAMAWTLFYTTAHGARFVYVLSSPIDAEAAETRLRGLIKLFRDNGLQVDDLWDWTRCFRLPWVVREKKPTWETPPGMVEYLEQLDNRLDPSTLPIVASTIPTPDYADIEVIHEPQPTPEECRALLEVPTPNGRRAQSAWMTEAKRRLKGRECYAALFEMKSLADPGGRDNKLLEATGQAVSLLYYLDGTTPAHVYSLFAPVVEQWADDPVTGKWTGRAWAMILRNWSREKAKALAIEQKAQVLAAEQKDVGNRILDGVRSWAQHPDLRSEDPAVLEAYIRRHAIVSVGNSVYVMTQEGYYCPAPMSPAQLVAGVRAMGMDGIIRTTTTNREGLEVDRPIQHILNESATIAKEVHAVPGLRKSYVQDMDAPHALLRVPCYARNPDLEAKFDGEVDTWLCRLFGVHVAQARKWIAYALDFESGPICALSLKGAAGAGKKMLAQGLAETLVAPALATADDLVGAYQYGLLASPFLVVNEGWPKSHAGRHPADQFRALVSGDPLTINRKFLSPVHITNPVRILFTSNNLDVVKLLTAGRELSPEDREALAVRLLHFDVGHAASAWLAERGGVQFTGRPGRRWIRADGGVESDFIVARHFLYLYEHRHEMGAPGGRFLVEGNADADVLFELRTQSGSSPLVIEAVLRMAEVPQKMLQGFVFVENRLFVLANEILEFFRTNMRGGGEKITIQSIANVFRGLAVSDYGASFVLKTREHLGRRRWQELDCAMLLQVAQRDGWRCETLRQVVARQDKAKREGTWDGSLGAVRGVEENI